MQIPVKDRTTGVRSMNVAGCGPRNIAIRPTPHPRAIVHNSALFKFGYSLGAERNSRLMRPKKVNATPPEPM